MGINNGAVGHVYELLRLHQEEPLMAARLLVFKRHPSFRKTALENCRGFQTLTLPWNLVLAPARFTDGRRKDRWESYVGLKYLTQSL